MSYDLTQEQYNRLARNRREGRVCATLTSGGGCFARGTWRETVEFWPYKIGMGKRQEVSWTHCSHHHLPVGYEGTNFRVLTSERIDP